MLTLSLIFKLLVFHCVDATRLQANNRTTKLWSTLAPEDERKKIYTYKTNSDGILFRGIQIKSIVSWFQCTCAWKKYDDGVCPVFIAGSPTHSASDELCCGKRCYFLDRQSQTNFIPHHANDDDYDGCAKGDYSNALTIHMY